MQGGCPTVADYAAADVADLKREVAGMRATLRRLGGAAHQAMVKLEAAHIAAPRGLTGDACHELALSLERALSGKEMGDG